MKKGWAKQTLAMRNEFNVCTFLNCVSHYNRGITT